MITIPTLIGRAAAAYRDAVAVRDERLSFTFADVHIRSNRLANALVAVSGTAGGRVAVLAPNRAELVEIDFAISKAGKVRVPVNARLGDDERRYVVTDSGADIIVVDAAYREFAETLAAEVDSLRHVVVLDGVGTGGRYDDLVAGGAVTAPDLAHPPEAGSFILYTSGTTGRPKGALSTNRGRLAATTAMLTDELSIPAGGAMAHVGSMAHGSGSKVLAYFLRGACNITVPRWDPDAFLDLVASAKVSGTFIVPTMLSALVDAWQRRRTDLSSLRSVSYGGAPIAPARLRAAVAVFGSALVQVYGSCEAPHPVFVLTGDDHDAGRGITDSATSVGREALHCEVRLVADDGRDTPAGQPGEMWVRGPNVMAGYWRNPEATAAVLDGDGWYRTGDVAWRDDPGYHYIVDRVRDVIISGGLNIYPAEVENAIHRHPAVADVAVVGVPDDVWGESVKAIVVRRPGAEVTGDALVAHCRATLAGYKKPRFVEFVDQLPKGATGKTLKRELRQRHWSGRDRAV